MRVFLSRYGVPDTPEVKQTARIRFTQAIIPREYGC